MPLNSTGRVSNWLLLILASAVIPFLSMSVQAAVTPQQAQALAKEAYIYGFPMVDNLRVQYSYFTDPSDPEYKAPYNTLFNIPRVFTPVDKAIQTPNSDTPYSWIGLDLRAEPIVFTVPAIPKERYWSLQLFNPGDLDNVKNIQSQYLVQPLSAFLDTQPPAPAPKIDFPKPLSPTDQKSSLEFFNHLNFGLQFAPTHPSETALMERFARIDVGAGKTFDASKLSPEMRQVIEQGIADAWLENEALKQRVISGELSSGDIFGTRDFLKSNYGYLLNSTMLPQFKRDPDGGLTLSIQHESPGKNKESNWLPAPAGHFSVIMRLYIPKAAALDGTWVAPSINRVQ